MIKTMTLALALMLGVPLAQASETERLALQGLPAEISLFINVPSAIPQDGIRGDTETLLTSAGLEVQDSQGGDARAALEIVVSSIPSFPNLTGSGGMIQQLKALCTTVVETRLSAPVVLKLTKQNSAAEVWSSMRFGVIDCDDESTVKNLVLEQVRKFTADYQVYNQ